MDLVKRLVSAVVLVFSLSATGVYVWQSSQKQSTSTPNENHATKPRILVTDEEVRIMRDEMLSSSKSGLIASDAEIRRMLEASKNNEEFELFPKTKPEQNDLAPSSKNPGRTITPEGLRRGIDAMKRQALPE